MVDVTNSVDFTAPGALGSVSNGGTTLTYTGLQANAVGGVFSQYFGLSILSPNDAMPGQGWTKEIDAYNDTREGVNLSFGQGQSHVSITLQMLYNENIYYTEAEKADYTATLDDGSTVSGVVQATGTIQPGAVTFDLDAATLGGHKIVAVLLQADTSLAKPPPYTIPPKYIDSFTKPYSEFTVGSVRYTHDNHAVALDAPGAGALTETVGTPLSGATLATSVVTHFTDADPEDTHTTTVTPLGTTLGAVTATQDADSTGGGAGQVTLAYGVDAAKVEYLSLGQQITEKFNVTVDDGHGGQATQEYDVTITGTNDGPAIDGANSALTGSVTELAATQGSAVVDTATGKVAFTDVDLADTHVLSVAPMGTTIGAVTLSPVTEVNGAGAAGWTYSVTDGALDYLAAGQHLTEQFTVTVDDQHGGTTQATISVDVVGANDAVTYDLAKSTTTGTVNELAAVTGSPATDTATGTLAFKDVDLTDTHVLSVAPVGTTLGTLTVGAPTEGGGAGTAGWTYNVADKALDSLAAGQKVVDTFNVTVDDGHGSTAVQAVSITLVGANDPVAYDLSKSTTTGTVTELANTKGSATLDTATGTLAFTDVDLTDTHVLSVAPVGTTLGALVIGAPSEGGGAGTAGWTYSVVDSKLDSLQAGQKVVETFNVTVDDGHGSTAVQAVSVTLIGANDAPTAVNDSTAVKVGASTGNLAAQMLSNDTDPDTGDTLTVLSVNTSGTKGAVAFDAATQKVIYTASGYGSLPNGQHATDTFTYTISDGHGGTSTATVSVDVAAPPIVTPPANNPVVIDTAHSTLTGSVNELKLTTGSSAADKTTGVLAFTDADKGDTHTVSVTPVGTTLGTLTFAPVSESNGAGSAAWSYSVTDSKLDYLKQGATLTETFTAKVSDGHGSTVSQNIVVTITGANDAPMAANDKFTVAAHSTSANLYSQIVANDKDVDVGDSFNITKVDTSSTQGIVQFDAATHTVKYIADADAFASLGKGASGMDSFGYTITDGYGATSTATVALTVTGVANTIEGNDCCNVICGTCGPNVIDGKGGDDLISGNGGADVLKGGSGCDIVFGCDGDDILYGQSGDDALFGGSGADVLIGGSGCNLLTGGSGADLFVFSNLTSRDTVLDFQVGTDKLYFENGITVTKVTESSSWFSTTTTLTLSNGGTVALLGVSHVTDWHALT